MIIVGDEIITPIGAAGMRLIGPGSGITPEPSDDRIETVLAMGDIVTADQVTPLIETG